MESIQIQTCRDFELIVTDDSPDNGVECLVNEFKEKMTDIPVIYHRNSPALGMPQNWNFALSLCKGEWIKIMHDDDWFSGKDSLAVYRHYAQSGHPLFIFSAYTNFYEKSGKKEVVDLTTIQKNRIEKDPLALIGENVIGPPSVVCVHHSVQEAYDERLKWRVDIDYYIRILKTVHSFVFISESLVNVGISSIQVTQSVKNIKAIELPEASILWEKYGMERISSLYVFDGWWRFIRNLHITYTDKSLLPGNEWPAVIEHMIAWQKNIPQAILKIGIFSKIFMAFSFFTFRIGRNA